MTDFDDELDDVTGEREERAYQFTSGGSFWGDGDQVLWADGESLVIDGPQGVGKTTLAQQLALGRAGFDEYAKLLGFPIIPGQRRVLYLAMDRPKQAARSFRRMVGEAWRADSTSGCQCGKARRRTTWQGIRRYC
jgi:replicative DNA helicase